jgi:hypothetical protein
MRKITTRPTSLQPTARRWLKFGAASAIALIPPGLFAQAPRPQIFPLHDANGLIAPKVKAEAVNYHGRKCVGITIDGRDHDGLALLPGTDFQDGVIEADIALRNTTPPENKRPGFIGIAFRVSPDASRYEVFYLRPGNSQAQDQAKRNHAVQYISQPGFGWYRLRREWPSVYESYTELELETWTKVRIEVAGRLAKIYLQGSPKPALVVDGLKGEDLHGGVGLWAYTDQEAYFSNVRITPAVPQAVKNGSDAAGSWDMQYSSDAAGMPASMELHRDGDKLTGTWSGPLGEDRPVSGIWRNGYIELSFAGDWPKEIPDGAPGPVNAFLAGWIDGDSAQGRMRVEGRADGTWVATRKSANTALR